MTSSPPVFPDSFISISVPEFTVGEIFDFNATDDVDTEGDGLTYAIQSHGSIPLSEVIINPDTGRLSIIEPTKELSSTAENRAAFNVFAFDSEGNSTTANVFLELTDVEEPPVFRSDTRFYVEDGASGTVGTASAYDQDDFFDESVDLQLSGPDADLFRLQFYGGGFADIVAEAPLTASPPNDANGDGIFELFVTADDGVSSTTVLKQIIIDGFAPPEVFGETFFSVENQINDYFLFGFDRDDDNLTYSIAGGPDAALFEMADPNAGRFRFLLPPDFEDPSDANGDNLYEFVAEVSDGNSKGLAVVAVEVEDDPDETSAGFVPTYFDLSNSAGSRAIEFSSETANTIEAYPTAPDAATVEAAGATFRAGDLLGNDAAAKISFIGNGLSIRRSSETWQERRLIDGNDVLYLELAENENFGRAQNLTLFFDAFEEGGGVNVDYYLNSEFVGMDYFPLSEGTSEARLTSQEVYDGLEIYSDTGEGFRLSGMAMDREDLSGSGGGGSSGGSTLVTLDFTNQEATGRAVTTLVNGGIVHQQVYTGYPTSLSVDAAGIDISANNTVAPDAKVSFLGNGLSVRSDQDNDFVVKGERKTVEANEELIFKFNDSPTLGNATELSLAFDYVAGNGNFLVDFYLDGEATISRTFLSSAIKVTGVDFDEVRLSTDGDLAFRLAEIEFLREDLIA